MRLYLMRHGIAIDREDPKCPSEENRYLTPDGVKKTRDAAKGLAALGIEPTVFLTSPLRRAVETAELTASIFGFPKERIRRSDALSLGRSPAALFKELAHLRAREVICFGHAPHLDEVIARALGSRTLVTSLKKAGVACVDLESVSPPRGTLVWILTPKSLRALSKNR